MNISNNSEEMYNKKKYVDLVRLIRQWGKDLGFSAIGIAYPELGQAEFQLQKWLADGFHGEMDYMGRHETKRSRPTQLVPGTQSIICARMDYLPHSDTQFWRKERQILHGDGKVAQIAAYAQGRDYHKILRARLQKLAQKITEYTPEHQFRVFCDSAPVMEVALAEQAGLGWRGKHTLLISREAGSFFFLGEIFTSLPLPTDTPLANHCGNCQACIDICPTRAIVGAQKLDARRCIAYLTIELKGSIPVELRPLIGNRVYGCDDCQLICPWNKFACSSAEADFQVRHGLDHSLMIDLFIWNEEEFNQKMAGSAIRRIGHTQWLRNLAIGLGNAAVYSPGDDRILKVLNTRIHHSCELVREHVIWAIEQHENK